jgi:hypothetical protein
MINIIYNRQLLKNIKIIYNRQEIIRYWRTENILYFIKEKYNFNSINVLILCKHYTIKEIKYLIKEKLHSYVKDYNFFSYFSKKQLEIFNNINIINIKL